MKCLIDTNYNIPNTYINPWIPIWEYTAVNKPIDFSEPIIDEFVTAIVPPQVSFQYTLVEEVCFSNFACAHICVQTEACVAANTEAPKHRATMYGTQLVFQHWNWSVRLDRRNAENFHCKRIETKIITTTRDDWKLIWINERIKRFLSELISR